MNARIHVCVCVCVRVPVCVQVAKELGIPYEDQEFLLEPDHGNWADNIAFDMGKDAADLGRYPAVILVVVLCNTGATVDCTTRCELSCIITMYCRTLYCWLTAVKVAARLPPSAGPFPAWLCMVALLPYYLSENYWCLSSAVLWCNSRVLSW